MKKGIIINIILICCLMISVVVNVIISRQIAHERQQSKAKILNYLDVGLNNLIQDNINNMYADCGWNPYLQGEFFEEKILQDIYQIIKLGEYIEIDEPEVGDEDGSGLFPSIKFYSDDANYSLTIAGNRVCVRINEERCWYYSNIASQISEVIDEIVDEYEEDFTEQSNQRIEENRKQQ